MKRKTTGGNSRPSRSSKARRNRTGRPASSSDVRLTPHFRNPVDIERLGKALVAIALRQTVELDTDSNTATDNHASRTGAADGDTGHARDGGDGHATQ